MREMAPGGVYDEAGLMAAARYTPEVLDHMGYSRDTVEPLVTLPNGVALHRWPPKYLTPAVRTFVTLHRTARGRALADGGVLAWPNWLADATAYLDANEASKEARRG